VSGAAFALFENLGYVSEVDSWSTLVLARIGTAIMHMVTAGLTGWALAKAWQDRSYLRLGFAYLAAVVIHGIWNAIAILYGIASLPVALDIPPYLPSHLIVSGPPLFALLTASLFFLLILYNRRLQPAGAQA
jgi:RsiW-degrading membrane proteinase PrsW (M82 family)